MKVELKASFIQYLTDCNDSRTTQQRVRWRVSGFSSQSVTLLRRASFSSAIRSQVPFHFASKEPLKITEISASPLTRTRILALPVHPPAFDDPFCKTSPNVRETVNLELSKEKSVQKRIKQTILVPFVNGLRNCSTWNTTDHSSKSALRSRPTEEKAAVL